VKIFVSYSRRDAGDFADQIYEHLREEHDIFTDVNNIQAGSIWSNEIENNISNCDLFVAIITHAALRSQEVETEVLKAQKEKKTIIPCFHRYVSKNEIKWDLSKIQGIEFYNNYQLARSLYQRITEIQKNSGKRSGDTSAETKEDSTDKGVSKSKDTSLFSSAIKEEKENKIEEQYYYPPTVKEEKRKQQSWISPKILIPIIIIAIGSIIAFAVFSKTITSPPPEAPNDVDTLLSKGIALNDLGRYDEAITYFDKALAINPNYKNALLSKGWSLSNLGRYDEAIEYYDRAIEIDPNYILALNNKGLALNGLGRYDEAITYFDKALAINPNYEWALNNKGNALNDLGRYDEAITYYDKALAINPNDEVLLNNKNNALKKLGNGT
jgi:tetratricopeptide (TPR) repeat protein